MRRNLNYKADLLEDLRNNAGFSAAYLAAAIADSREAFLVALRDVAEARRGMTQLATEANVNRESLYRTLSVEGNPRFSTLESVLDALGMDLTIKLKPTFVETSPSTPASSIVTTGTTASTAVDFMSRGFTVQVKTGNQKSYSYSTSVADYVPVASLGANPYSEAVAA